MKGRCLVMDLDDDELEATKKNDVADKGVSLERRIQRMRNCYTTETDQSYLQKEAQLVLVEDLEIVLDELENRIPRDRIENKMKEVKNLSIAGYEILKDLLNGR